MHILKINTTDVCIYIYIYMHTYTHTYKCFVSFQGLIKNRTQGTKIKHGVLTPTFSLIRKVLYHAEFVTHSATKTMATQKSILGEAIPSCRKAGQMTPGWHLRHLETRQESTWIQEMKHKMSLFKCEYYEAPEPNLVFLSRQVVPQQAPKDMCRSSWRDSHHCVSCPLVSLTIHQLF